MNSPQVPLTGALSRHWQTDCVCFVFVWLRGDVVPPCGTRETALIGAEIGEIDHFWMGTSYESAPILKGVFVQLHLDFLGDLVV